MLPAILTAVLRFSEEGEHRVIRADRWNRRLAWGVIVTMLSAWGGWLIYTALHP